ncbi:MAG: 2,3-bisphosphoglycerate-independent phosphoglycerate mutase [Candidatus Helarchaeota archaeon]
MKAILIICDGMGDRPSAILKGKTPLEVANTPNLDQLSELGINGIMDPISPGIPPGSDTSHLSLFGYDPYKYYNGRGGFEALGIGMEVNPGDVAFRGNFATVNENHVILDRRAGRYIPEAKDFEALVDNYTPKCASDTKIIIEHSVEHRVSVKIIGPNLSPNISDVDPHKTNVKIHECKALDNSDAARRTAEIVNEYTKFTYETLKDHPLNKKKKEDKKMPVNIIILRGAGTLPNVTSIEKIFNIKASYIAGGALYKGVAKSVGMHPIDVPGATGGLNTDVIAKGQAAIDNLKNNDFIFLHVKGTDSASHDGNAENKIWMIEQIDKMVGLILKNIDLNETLISVTADHTTPIEVRDHTSDPVPLIITAENVLKDSVKKYSELTCSQGGIGRIRGLALIHILMDYIGKTKKFGA